MWTLGADSWLSVFDLKKECVVDRLHFATQIEIIREENQGLLFQTHGCVQTFYAFLVENKINILPVPDTDGGFVISRTLDFFFISPTQITIQPLSAEPSGLVFPTGFGIQSNLALDHTQSLLYWISVEGSRFRLNRMDTQTRALTFGANLVDIPEVFSPDICAPRSAGNVVVASFRRVYIFDATGLLIKTVSTACDSVNKPIALAANTVLVSSSSSQLVVNTETLESRSLALSGFVGADPATRTYAELGRLPDRAVTILPFLAEKVSDFPKTRNRKEGRRRLRCIPAHFCDGGVVADRYVRGLQAK